MSSCLKLSLVLVAGALSTTSAAACDAAISKMREAAARAEMDTVGKIVAEVQTRADCPSDRIIAARRFAALTMLKEVNRKLAQEKATNEQVEPLLVKAHALRASWQVADLLGELRQEQKRFNEAAQLHQEALDILRDMKLTPTAPAKEHIASVFKRAETARLLAATYVPTSARPGKRSGLAVENYRGWAPVAVAWPVTFEFDSVDFTSDGRKAADDLARSLADERPAGVTLVGHTDEVGEAEYNQKLSLSRAEALRDHLEETLRGRGVRLRIGVRGEGETRPYETPIRETLTEEEAYQLDRRVELVRE